MKKVRIILILVMMLCLSGCTNNITESSSYQVVFDLKGGITDQQTEVVIKRGETIELFTPIKTGYTFLGWKENNKTIDTKVYTVNRHLNFVAEWELTNYEITFLMNGSTSHNDMKKTVTYQESFILPIPTKRGYTFLGWFLDGQLFEENVWKITHDVTLEARWEKSTYVITFETGYETTISTQTVNLNQVFKLPVLERAGYTFLGWMINNELIDYEIWILKSDAIAVAKWEAVDYLLTLDYGYDEVKDTFTLEYEQALSLPILNREGYQFIGWYLNDTLFNDSKYQYQDNLTIVAKWLKTYNIQYVTYNDTLIPTATYTETNEVNLPIPTLTNHQFMGWYDNPYFQNEKYEKLAMGTTGDKVFYARWQNNDENHIMSLTSSLYAMQTSEYKDLSIYPQDVKPSASLYWYKIGVKRNEHGKYLITGIKLPNEVLSLLDDYDYLLIAYPNYPNYQELINASLSIGDELVFSTSLSTFKTGSINVMIDFIKGTLPYAEISRHLTNEYNNISEVTSDLVLIDNYQNIDITWKTSNHEVISSTGVYHQPSVTREVTLQAIVGTTLVFTKNVRVNGLQNNSKALATGYIYTGWSKLTDHTTEVLDIIYCAFAYTDSEGNFTNMSETSTYMKNVLTYVMPKARLFGTKVIFSVNQQNGSFATLASNETARKKLANNIVLMINKYGFSGVDIDWETPTTATKQNFTLLMKDIYLAVKANNPEHLVTAAIGGGKWQPPRYDLENSVQYLDYINWMLYSMTSANGQFQSALYKSTKGYTLSSCSVQESLAIFDGYYVPRAKLLLGIPFYGIRQSGSAGIGTTSTGSSSVTYAYLVSQYLVNPPVGVIVGYDEECQVPYIYDRNNGWFFSYDDPRSIERKCEYINTHGLGGIMYWQDNQDDGDTLINAIEANIRK